MGLLGGLGSVVGGLTSMPWLGALGGALDSVIDKGDAAHSQGEANAFNAAEAQKTRDFQERMRSTQYQTAVKDMQAAGLNPMLAYSQGGAGTPSGATSAPAVAKLGTGMSSARQSADTVAALQSVEASKAQVEQVKATTDKIRSETMTQTLNSAMLQAQLDNVLAATENRDADTSNKKAEWKGKVSDSAQKFEQLDADVRANTFSADSARRKALSALTQMEIPKAKADQDFYENLGRANPYLKQIFMLMQMLRGGSSAFSAIGR